MNVKLEELMESSGVRFGTSGARGLVKDMTDYVCYIYTKGFLQYLENSGELKKQGEAIPISGDLRPSTYRIINAVHRAIKDMGYKTVNCGLIPSPAIALYGIVKHIPSIMVTGSHIPDDRNGIKFNKSEGEIMKYDETGIKEQVVTVDKKLFSDDGMFAIDAEIIPETTDEAHTMFFDRYINVFPKDCLKGFRIGFYQHSAVGRTLIVDILEKLGAEVTKLGFSDTFIPVDTEAIREEDIRLAKEWCDQYRFNTILSTDGDSDRPLISDEYGKWLTGDVAGILCAKYLGAETVCTPVSCNSAVEKCSYFKDVKRTRIGSPYVIDSMFDSLKKGSSHVVGYEANGGFLTASDIEIDGNVLAALPTRDAVVLHLGVLLLAKRENLSVSQLVNTLPQRYTASNRLKEFPLDKSRNVIGKFSSKDEKRDRKNIEDVFGQYFGKVMSIDSTDGIRITFQNNEVIHLRPSGNAPEFRCYNEAASEQRVKEMSSICMDILKTFR